MQQRRTKPFVCLDDEPAASLFSDIDDEEDDDLSPEDSRSNVLYYNDRTSRVNTPTSDTLSILRERIIRAGDNKRVLWHIKEMTVPDQLKYRTLMDQTVLATFFEQEDGRPLKSENWTGVIKSLYEKIFHRSADTIPAGCIKAV
jgi:hypothetical protein